MQYIATNRSQLGIAFEMDFQVVRQKRVFPGGELPYQVLKETGCRIIWLPPATTISPYEAVNLILRERYNLKWEKLPPSWVELYKLPHQKPIEAEIGIREQEIQRLQGQIEDAQERLRIEARYQQLLYEQGEDMLEPVVRDALREMGATVEDPERRGREDGRLIDPFGRLGMLEIKGRSGTIRLQDIRQLQDWVTAAVADEVWEGKGILIGNAYSDTLPDERGAPFAPNAVQAAVRFEQWLMTTLQIFQALVAYQNGELDLRDFWDTIFTTNGICLLPDP